MNKRSLPDHLTSDIYVLKSKTGAWSFFFSSSLALCSHLHSGLHCNLNFSGNFSKLCFVWKICRREKSWNDANFWAYSLEITPNLTEAIGFIPSLKRMVCYKDVCYLQTGYTLFCFKLFTFNLNLSQMFYHIQNYGFQPEHHLYPSGCLYGCFPKIALCYPFERLQVLSCLWLLILFFREKVLPPIKANTYTLTNSGLSLFFLILCHFVEVSITFFNVCPLFCQIICLFFPFFFPGNLYFGRKRNFFS